MIKTLNIKSKERILRASKEKCQVTYKGRCIRITADFSLDTMNAITTWSSLMETLRDQGSKPRLLYPAKLSITIDRKNRIRLGSAGASVVGPPQVQVGICSHIPCSVSSHVVPATP